MESECFFDTFKKAFLTGAGYAFSLVFTSKFAEYAGLFKSQQVEKNFRPCNCNCNCEEESDVLSEDTSELVNKTDVHDHLNASEQNPDKFKNLLNKL